MSGIYVKILGFKNDDIHNSIINGSLLRKYKYNRTNRFVGKVGKLLEIENNIKNIKPNLYVIGFIQKWCGHISVYKVVVFLEEIKRVDDSETKEFIELFDELNAKVIAEKL